MKKKEVLHGLEPCEAEKYSQSLAQDIYEKLASMMDQDPGAAEVQQVIAAWRQHITDHFYDCTIEVFRSLGELYARDQRFIAQVERFGIGLAGFIYAAVGVYCDRGE